MNWFRRLLSSVKGNDTEQATLLSRRGDELAAAGALTEASEAYEEAIEKALTYPAGKPDPFEWQAHLRAGVEYLKQGSHENYERAHAALIKGAALGPDAYTDYEIADHQHTSRPFELLAECYLQTGRSESAREALRKHVEIRRTCEGLRARAAALEAQPAESYAPWRLRTLRSLLKLCGEYEAEAAGRLAEVSREAEGGSERG